MAKATTIKSSALPVRTFDSLSISELVQVHEWCMSIFELSVYYGNMPRTDEDVEDFMASEFTNRADKLMDAIQQKLLAAVPKDEREAEHIAKVLVPYHMENENLAKASTELARLIYLTTGLGRASAVGEAA